METNKKLNAWDIVNSKIDESKIKRYPWKAILGETLTHYIISRKIKGFKAAEVYKSLLDNERIKAYIKTNPDHMEKIKENLKISVSARYGENDSSLHTFRELKK